MAVLSVSTPLSTVSSVEHRNTGIHPNMPSDLSFWIVSVPLPDGDPNSVVEDVRKATGGTVPVGGWEIPELKVCPSSPP